MKKNTLKRFTALLLSLGLALQLTACSDKSWSVKDNTQSLPTGVYIYYLYVAYQNAISDLSQNTSEDISGGKSILNKIIENKKAKQWIMDNAMGNTKNVLAVDAKLKEMNISVTDEEINKSKERSDENWSEYGSVFEGFGISKSSYDIATGIADAKYNKLYNSLYGESGSKTFSDEEINSYFLNHYTSYSYIKKDIISTSSVSSAPEIIQDDSGAISSGSSEMTSEQLSSLEQQFNGYADSINSGAKNIETIAQEFQQSEGLSESPLVSQTENLENSSQKEKLKEALKTLQNNTAQLVKTDDSYYLLYKKDINSQISELNKPSTSTQSNDTSQTADSTASSLKVQVLNAIRLEDFKNTLKNTADSIDIVVNDSVVRKYSPRRLEKKLKEY